MQARWLARLARHLELPAEAFGVTRLVVVGQDRVEVENHRGLVAFSSREVVLRTDAGRVRVDGENLTLDLLWPDRLRVVGRIEAIRLQE